MDSAAVKSAPQGVGMLRRLYHRLPAPPSTNYQVADHQAAFWSALKPGDAVYDIGSKGQAELSLSLIPAGVRVRSIDIDPSAQPDIVADAHDLHMVASGSVDAVFTSSVLEHVRDPWKVVGEIERILKPGGMVFIGMPFMFPFHADPDDFWRVSHRGIDLLCARFDKIESGYGRGPASCWTHMTVHFLALLFSFRSTLLYGVLVDLFKWSLFWVKWTDKLIAGHPQAHVIHAATYFIGRKR